MRRVFLGLFLVACGSSSSESETTTKSVDQRTVASLTTSPPTENGTKVALDVVVIVSQQNGKKWRAYVQDPGQPNGIGLFCDAGASTPCTAQRMPTGARGTLDSLWSPQAASKLEPVSFVAREAGTVTYASLTTAAALASASGTPARLTGGPWVVSDVTSDTMKNPAWVSGDCASGPPRFGVEVTDTSDGTKLSLMLKWFDAVSLTTDDGACGAGKTLLAKGQRFVALGGLVEATGFGGLALEPFSDADWRFQ